MAAEVFPIHTTQLHSTSAALIDVVKLIHQELWATKGSQPMAFQICMRREYSNENLSRTHSSGPALQIKTPHVLTKSPLGVVKIIHC